MTTCFLEQVQYLEGPDLALRHEDVLIEQGRLAAIGPQAVARAEILGLTPWPAARWLLAPALVDPHSVLEQPAGSVAETLESLMRAAAAAGYGTVALLPRGRSWRDQPEHLLLAARPPFQLPLWAGFSLGGAGLELAPHADLIAAGAIGLAEDDTLPPLPLLERGLRLGEAAGRPVLLAPRDAALSRGGFVREGVEALRVGWPLDPPLSETLPLQSILALDQELPAAEIRLAQLSTAAGVTLLRSHPRSLPASVCWWHLVADSGRLDPVAEGWRVVPALGGPDDRRSLLAALADGVLSAVAVQHVPLDAEECLLPIDQRRPGLAGHGFVLPALWQELVLGAGWSIPALWQVLCWGPARFLGLAAETLQPGSERWILFDPERRWEPGSDAFGSRAANQPYAGCSLTGQVLASGLLPELWRGGEP
ncbi:dihydroorotase [Synechococcus sp. CS-1325]|uniref:dihydroorotase n=1 Tax=Synechococcus sp. CS-1325 TaxID=2847979 RepID=UPI000DB6FD3F|nr:dihydroorotase [Synechococcus sp. CS-1325]MCT0199521.1 dihydroorotase [Synechococcus sp. CS-1325]PZV02532.1 MAG: dihydroorotase [Cyanobium sp.]